MKKITEQEFKKLFNEIDSINELAEYLEVSRVTIRNWARKFGLPPRNKTLIVSLPQNTNMVLREQGEVYDQDESN